MKKIFTLFLSGIIGVSFAQTQLHNAKVTGIITMGNKEVAAIQDLETECIFKSEAHPKGLFQQNDEVQLELTTEEQGKILKPSLPEVVYAHRHNCKNENNGREFTEAEVRDNMTAISVGLTELSTNQAFVDLVYTEVAKEFDGDYNVLLKTLHTETAKNLNFSLEAELRKLAKKHGYVLQNGFVHGFKTSNKDFKFYPQVFVPDFENINKNTSIVSGAYFGDDASTITGYTINNSGQLETRSLTEQLVVTDKIVNGFIVSINERVNKYGNPSPNPNPINDPIYSNDPPQGGGSIGGEQGCPTPDGYCSPSEAAMGCEDCQPQPPVPTYVVGDCQCDNGQNGTVDLGENYSNSPNDCSQLPGLCGDGTLQTYETPCNCPEEFDNLVRKQGNQERILNMRFGNLGGYESWGAGAPEIQVIVKRQDGFQMQPELEPQKRSDINEVWWQCDYDMFLWNVYNFRYYTFVMLEVDRFVTSSTDYETTISGTYQGVAFNQTLSGTFDWEGEKELISGQVNFDEVSPNHFGSSSTFETNLAGH